MRFSKIFKSVSVFLIVAIFFSYTSLITKAEEIAITTIDDFEYSINEEAISINGYLGKGNSISIAETYNIDGKNLPVIAIGEYAFEGTSIESIIFPDSLITVSEGAFYNCDELHTIILPESVLYVGNYAFDDCNSLTDITVFNSKTKIGDSAFGYYAVNEGTNRNPVWKYYVVDGVVLKGYNNSTVNAYADDNGIIFEKLTSTILGDLNQDNGVDIIDLIKMKNCVLNIDNTVYNTDVNGDGVLANASDIIALKILIFYGEENLPVYNVNFEDSKGNILKQQNVYWCFSAKAPTAPEIEGYNFSGWDKDFSSVKSDITIKATYSPIMLDVTFIDFNGSILKTEAVAYGKNATPPSNPEREGYTFIGWDTDYNAIKSAVIITAKYKKISENFTVTFKDYDGGVLASDIVPFGEAATLPEEPKRTGYIFAGWSGMYSNVTEESTVIAQYISEKEQNVFKVSNVNGTKDSTVSVTVELTGSVMMNGYELILNYDSEKLKLGTVISGSGVIYNQAENNQIKISYFNKQCINEYNSRVILTIKFTVLSDESVAVPLTLECADVFDASDNSVPYTAINGQVVIN